MANGHGGYRRPTTPAQVSGPGAASKRTDGGPSVDSPKQAARYISGGEYGEGQEMMSIQQGAPMAASPDVPPMNVTPFGAPTAFADEPITAGADFGSGPGSEVLPFADVPESGEPDLVAAAVRAAFSEYPSPYLRVLVQQLDMQGR
jgi:hypothetical protein